MYLLCKIHVEILHDRYWCIGTLPSFWVKRDVQWTHLCSETLSHPTSACGLWRSERNRNSTIQTLALLKTWLWLCIWLLLMITIHSIWKISFYVLDSNAVPFWNPFWKNRELLQLAVPWFPEVPSLWRDELHTDTLFPAMSVSPDPWQGVVIHQTCRWR